MILRSLRQRLSAAIQRVLAARRRDRTSSLSADALQAPLSDIGQWLSLTPTDVERHLAAALVHLDRQIGTISPEGTVASDSADR